jgi:hypothetical protein
VGLTAAVGLEVEIVAVVVVVVETGIPAQLAVEAGAQEVKAIMEVLR